MLIIDNSTFLFEKFKNKYIIHKMNENIISPCISICKTDPLTGYCYGCGRTKKEKIIWKDPNTINAWKEKNLKIMMNRLTGWQKKAFQKSYLYKNQTGMSLIKKKILESKDS